MNWRSKKSWQVAEPAIRLIKKNLLSLAPWSCLKTTSSHKYYNGNKCSRDTKSTSKRDSCMQDASFYGPKVTENKCNCSNILIASTIPWNHLTRTKTLSKTWPFLCRTTLASLRWCSIRPVSRFYTFRKTRQTLSSKFNFTDSSKIWCLISSPASINKIWKSLVNFWRRFALSLYFSQQRLRLKSCAARLLKISIRSSLRISLLAWQRIAQRASITYQCCSKNHLKS